jgi:phosphate transport system substrate-binding protein
MDKQITKARSFLIPISLTAFAAIVLLGWMGSKIVMRSGAVSGANAGKRLADVQRIPAGQFNYGGSSTWAPIRLGVDSVLQAARPEFQLRYVNSPQAVSNPKVGIQMLVDGKIAFAQSSQPIQNNEAQVALQRGGSSYTNSSSY